MSEKTRAKFADVTAALDSYALRVKAIDSNAQPTWRAVRVPGEGIEILNASHSVCMTYANVSAALAHINTLISVTDNVMSSLVQADPQPAEEMSATVVPAAPVKRKTAVKATA